MSSFTSVSQIFGKWLVSNITFSLSGAEPSTYIEIRLSGSNVFIEEYTGTNTQVVTPTRTFTPFSTIIPLSALSVTNGILYALEFPVGTIICNNQTLILFSMILERVTNTPNTLLSNNTNWTDATNLINWYYALASLKNTELSSVNQNNFKYCPKQGQEILDRLLTGRGYLKERSVTNIYKTTNPQTYPVTTLIFKYDNPFNSANRVTISGLTNEWAVLNGEHTISVLSGDFRFTALQSDLFSESSYIYVLFNSASLPTYDSTKHGCAKAMAVQQPISADSEYAPLIGAVLDILRSNGPFVHERIAGYVIRSTAELINSRLARTYAEINSIPSNLAFSTITRYRPGLHCAPFYVFTTASFNFDPSWWHYNNPYLIPQTPYNVPLNNYLEANTLRVLWYRSAVPGVPYANLVAIVQGSLGLIDVPLLFGVETIFEFAVSDFNTAPPLGSNPNTWLRSPLGDPINTRLAVGLIKTSLTGGKRIGYLLVSNFSAFDSSSIITDSLRGVARNFDVRLLISQGYAAISGYLKQQLQVEELIIDNRLNTGGFLAYSTTLGSVFGADREIVTAYTKDWSANCSVPIPNREIYEGTPLEGSAVANIFSSTNQFPSIVQEKFGDVVLTNINIYQLTSTYSFSGGTIFSNTMLGDIGANTRVYVLGDSNIINSVGNDMSLARVPINRYGNNLITSSLTNNTPFSFVYNTFSLFRRNSPDSSVGEFVAQLAPLIILNHDWRVIYRDLGYEPNECHYLLPGTPTPNISSTWKDSWLETSIRLILSEIN